MFPWKHSRQLSNQVNALDFLLKQNERHYDLVDAELLTFLKSTNLSTIEVLPSIQLLAGKYFSIKVYQYVIYKIYYFALLQ